MPRQKKAGRAVHSIFFGPNPLAAQAQKRMPFPSLTQSSVSWPFLVYLYINLYNEKDRIYKDTSIVGGYFDIEFELETKLLFERLEK